MPLILTRGRDQEDGGLKTAQVSSLRDYLEKNPSQKKLGEGAGGVVQGVDPEFKPQYSQKKFLLL
jgi:hypothetical protein